MNNKTSLIINGVLAIAIVILFYMQFSKPATTTEKTDEPTSEEISSDTSSYEGPQSGLSIAYVNSDTLTKYYEYNKVLTNELMGKQASAEAKLKSLYQQYQDKAQKFEQKAPIMGQDELERSQMELYQMQQDIAGKEQELQNSLSEKSYKAQLEYMLTTDKYTQKIGKELGYDYIIGYRTGDLIMYANPKFDITQKVIKLLNEEYQKDQETAE